NVPEVYELSGRLFLGAGDPDQAIRELEEGARKFPKNKPGYQKLIVDALGAQNKTADAARLNDEILREHPNDADALARQADYSLQSGDVAKAVANLEALLQRSPNHPVAHYNLGRALLAAGRQGNARFQFSEAIRWAPDFIPARIALIKIQLAAGEYGDASNSADDILALNDAHGEAKVLRVMALRGLGKMADARKEIKALLALHPDYDQALFELGQIEVSE